MVAATRIFSFTVTIPAQTAQDVPVTSDVSFPPASVVTIRWRVPPGPSGFMGFAITSDGAPVIPQQSATYIVADNEAVEWDITGYQDSGSWQVTGYNTDSFDHAVYLDFLTVPPGQDQPAQAGAVAAPAPLSDASLSSPPPDISTFTAGIEVQS